MPDDEILKSVQKQYDFEQRIKAISCINCWNKKEDESAALWKIYSDFDKGIMIKSSIADLENSLKQSPERLYLSEIKYLDYEKETMPDGSTMFPLIHKQKAYSYEDEVRLIHEVKHFGWVHDWGNEEVKEGIFVPVDLNILIHEIIIGPFSPNWYLGMIQDISNKYGLNKPIRRSILSKVK